MLGSDIVIALPYAYGVDFDDLAGIDCDQSAADMGHFIIPFRCEVVLAGLVVTETCSGGTTTPVVDFDLRPTAGDDTSRGAADIAHFVLGTTAAGKVLYDLAAIGTVLEPGQEVVCELNVAATGSPKTGHVRPFLLVKYRAETLANLTDMVATT